MGAEQRTGPSEQAIALQSRAAPIIERAPLPIVEVQGSAHLISYVNSAFCKLIGKSRPEVIGKPFSDIVNGGKKCLPILDQVYQTGEAATLAQEDDSDLEPAHWLYAMWPTLDGNEKPVGVIIQLTKAHNFRQNVTAVNEALLIAGLRQHELTEQAGHLNSELRAEAVENRRMAEALRVSEERFRAIIDQTTAGIAETDLQGRFILANDHYCRITGYPRAELLEKNLRDIIHPEDLPANHESFSRLVAEGTPFVAEKRYIRKDGSMVWVNNTVSLIRGASGEAERVVAVTLDITERKRAQETMRQIREQLGNQALHLEALVKQRTAELLAANKQLETFVYSIAHDLRAPLRSMQGFSALLIEEAGAALSGEAKDYAHRISKSAQFMDALLVDLLAFSRISQEDLEIGTVNLETIVKAALAPLEKEIQERAARVEVAGAWPAVVAHAASLRQVMVNLVSNGLKFVPPGTKPVVSLWAEEFSIPRAPAPPGGPQPAQEHPEGNVDWVRVWVEDNGIGIAPEHQEQIFRLFTRLRGDAYVGTGIGLAIVQIGIERMGGRVGLESAPGKGSRFWFELRKG